MTDDEGTLIIENQSQVGEYLALIYDTDGDPVGSLRSTDLDALRQHLKEAAEDINCSYVLLEVIDTMESKQIH